MEGAASAASGAFPGQHQGPATDPVLLGLQLLDKSVPSLSKPPPPRPKDPPSRQPGSRATGSNAGLFGPRRELGATSAASGRPAPWQKEEKSFNPYSDVGAHTDNSMIGLADGFSVGGWMSGNTMGMGTRLH